MITKTIGLDLDNTYADFTGALREFASIGRNLSQEEALELMPNPQEYNSDIWNLEGTEHESFYAAFKAAEKQGLYSSMKPLPNAEKACGHLVADGYRFVAVTSRPEQHRAETSQWLEQHAPFVEALVHTDDKFELHRTYGGSVDIFIDDAPKQIEQMAHKDVPLIVFSQLYNEGYEKVEARRNRADNWMQVPWAVQLSFNLEPSK